MGARLQLAMRITGQSDADIGAAWDYSAEAIGEVRRGERVFDAACIPLLPASTRAALQWLLDNELPPEGRALVALLGEKGGR